jgi:Holliday junction DNA helicase RuvA
MIASLKGKLRSLGADSAVVDVNGIGFRVYMPTSSLASLGDIGAEVELETYLHLREDSATLFGFPDAAALEIFKVIIGVSGVGPKLGLALLSAMDADQLSMVITSGDAEILTEIPGIGKKLAARLILELKDKIAPALGAAPAGTAARDNADVQAALISLGYSAQEASRAVAGLPREKTISLEDRVKMALASLARK